jgi:uncharacterized protein (UPF0147 family)
MNERTQEVISCLEELKNESDINKKLVVKADVVISILTENSEMAIEKALIELEELNSLNLPTYHRTQVWDIVSLLESLKN